MESDYVVAKFAFQSICGDAAETHLWASADAVRFRGRATVYAQMTTYRPIFDALAVVVGCILAASCLAPKAQGKDKPANTSSSSEAAALSWTSTGPIIGPVSDELHDLVAVKDPTIVRYNDRWHVYASSVSSAGAYNIVYVSFADWKDASKAKFYYMDQTPGWKMYVAAPQLFYFTPQKKWYLVFQSGPPMFSTNDDPGDPTKWTEPAPFYAKEPTIVAQNGGWLDFWVTCDTANCHMFFSNDKGRWYHSKTSIGKFPYGFSEPEVAMEDAEAGRLFEACNVYKIAGTNKYLALIEAFDGSSNQRRYFRSWTSERSRSSRARSRSACRRARNSKAYKSKLSRSTSPNETLTTFQFRQPGTPLLRTPRSPSKQLATTAG